MDHYVQCLCHLAAHDEYESVLLIYFTPTCMAFYMVHRVPALWRVLKFRASQRSDYLTKLNLARMTKTETPNYVFDYADQVVLYDTVMRLRQFELAFSWEQELGIVNTDYFSVDLPTIPLVLLNFDLK